MWYLSAIIPVRHKIERLYPHATYTRSLPSTSFEISPSENVSPVRWSSILDPNSPNALPADISPIHVYLRPGETLYLPAGWWHYVEQAKETTIAINWWYDMEMHGMHWVFLNFLRNRDGLYINSEEDDELDVSTR